MIRFIHWQVTMRVTVDHAFERLKERWNVLRMICAHPRLASSLPEEAAALLNVSESRSGSYNETVDEEADRAQSVKEVAEGDKSPLSLGSLCRAAILKALGFP